MFMWFANVLNMSLCLPEVETVNCSWSRNELLAIIVHVLLVDLIGKEEEAFLFAHLDDLLDIGCSQQLTGRVARVDHNLRAAVGQLGEA